MKLRQQLFLVSLSFLTLPWVGCEYIKTNEQTLQKLQQGSLTTVGLTVADALASDIDLLYPYAARAQAPFDPASLQVNTLSTAPVIDGYLSEWSALPVRRFGTSRRPMSIQLAKYQETLFIGLSIADETKRYNTAPPGFEPVGDRLVISVWLQGQRQQYLVSTPAPGPVGATAFNRRLTSARPESITGVWTDVAGGYQIELAMPLKEAGPRFGMYYLDADEGGISTRGNIEPLETQAPPWLVISSTALDAWLARYEQQSLEIQILDRWGWPLGHTRPSVSEAPSEAFWLVQWLFEQVLDPPATSAPITTSDTGQAVGHPVEEALRGIPHRDIVNAKMGLVTRFTAPVRGDSGPIGVVVVRQPRDRYLSLHASAFEGLLLWGLAAMALSSLTVLGYASLLSGRIRRVAEASRDLQRHDTALHVDRVDDEISELVTAFNDQLARQRELRNYLTTLPQSLAHEIRTPIAIVRTSLELLAEEANTDKSKELFLRAEQGVERLSHLLRVMNEANRLEQAIGDEAQQATDLYDLLSELRAAYASTFPGWHFVLDADNSAAVTALTPDMVVQALDKLIANATSFTAAGGTITLRLRRRGLWWRVTVFNPGPPLPGDRHQIFEPMVSLRQPRQGTKGGLGLGLYIVKLVATHHGGEPWARNHKDGAEVGFTLRA